MTKDIVAVIVKIDFGDKSGVYPNEYLEEMKRGYWDSWNTPRKYKHLDGKGRKLFLYDSKQKALTVKVEIQKVEKIKGEREYPWSNKFTPHTLTIFTKPISVEQIRKVAGLENFGIHRKDRSPYRNLTREQYAKLIANAELEEYDVDDIKAWEGYQSDKKYLRAARNREIVERRKEKDKYTCKACEFRLQINGKFIIECHHTIPLADAGERVTNIDALVCLCPTCHRIAHTRKPPYSIKELRKILSSMS